MKTVRFVAVVDDHKCNGCRLCEPPCPTMAIKVVDRRAWVEEGNCLACPNCSDLCPREAVSLVRRPRPLVVGIDPQSVDEAKTRELCIKARLHPQQYVCLCTSTRASEAAAAVLQGARSPEQIALMTGARSGCTLYCVEPMLRLLKAHGVAVEQPRGYRWYDTTPTLWDVPADLAAEHPRYYFEPDTALFRKPQRADR